MPLTARSGYKNGFYAWLNEDPQACFNNYVFLSLQNPAKPGKFSICINPTSSGNGSYSAQTMTLSFPTEYAAGDFRIIGHELFHVFQDKFYVNGIAQYATGTRTGFTNIEFEHALYADLIFTTNPLLAMSHAPSDIRAEYQIWVNLITNNRTTLPTEYSQISSQYFYFLGKWKESYSGTQYDSPIDPNLKPEAMLNIFKNSPCN